MTMMTDNSKFTVRYPKSDMIIFFLAWGFFAAFGIMLLVMGVQKLLAIVMLVYLSLMAAAMICSTLLFGVKVDGDSLKLRTRLGRKYEFTLSDIRKVVCSKNSSIKYGPRYTVIIRTDDREIELMKSMKGFKEMCGYLLDRHSAGELAASAISKNCAATLKKYSQEK